MSKICWMLLIYALVFVLSWPRIAYPRPFDHFAVGYIGGSLISKGVEKVSPNDKAARFIIPVLAMGFVGFIKEWAQYQDQKGYSDDLVDDMGMVMVGAAAGSVVEIEFDCLICL